jgi:3-hydroxyacyl-CoA dehydrogenase
MAEVVRWSRDGDVAVITVDNPPVNAISHAVRKGIVEAVAAAEADPAVAALVLACAGRTFMAGADITEFGKPWADPGLREVVLRLEDCAKPVVAAIHGTALGGGFEIALGCHYRCAVSSAQVGFPEVHLGLIPGAHGTQRLPRLVGVRAALDMIVSGKSVPAPHAQSLGAIDEIVEGDLVAGAAAYARRLVARGAGPRRLRDAPVAGEPVDAAFFTDYRTSIAEKTRGYFAPERCVQALEAAVTLHFEEGVRRERELFEACLASSESRAQRHVFFGERAVARIPDLPKDTPVRRIERVGVVGAGTMGAGIAISCADAGLAVTVREADEGALKRGLARIDEHYAGAVRKGRLTPEQARERRARITGTLAFDDLGDVDLVIEAVYESMALKKEVFAALDSACRTGAILASNTSTLDLNEIAAATSRPADVIGLHYFSPAHVMRLLEVVRGARTAHDVLATAMAFAKRTGKIGVVSGVCFGFIGNRMFGVYMREVNLLLLEGATPGEVDGAMEAFGFRLGPCAVSDLAGLDVGYKVRREHAARPDDPRYGRVEDALVERGRHGQKNGRGFYRYDEGSHARKPEPDVHALIESEAARLGIVRRRIAASEIEQRCLFAMVNEGARILEEGIALRPVDIDIVYVNGYGFPAFRGGPMFHADEIGLDRVCDAIRAFRERDERYGYWDVAPLLERLARERKRFADLSA